MKIDTNYQDFLDGEYDPEFKTWVAPVQRVLQTSDDIYSELMSLDCFGDRTHYRTFFFDTFEYRMRKLYIQVIQCICATDSVYTILSHVFPNKTGKEISILVAFDYVYSLLILAKEKSRAAKKYFTKSACFLPDNPL